MRAGAAVCGVMPIDRRVFMIRRFPPVRRPVPLRLLSPTGFRLASFLAPFELTLCRSGTQALAIALRECACRATAPEVILPAYGCPDLVAACMYAGVVPRLVDNAPGRWGYDIAALEAALTDTTVAVVAVNFLGVGDQSEVLKSVLRRHPGISIIHDSAQYLPVENVGSWTGQHVVFSFGRGKPLNLLGGGLLLSRRPIPTLPESEGFSMRQALLGSSVAAFAFNALTHPLLYGLSSRLPGLGVGETVYRDLNALSLPNAKLLMRVEAAWDEYRTRPGYDSSYWRAALDSWSDAGISLLRCDEQMEAHGLNLRLPLLCKSRAQRDHLLAQINTAGLGGSAMYRVPLNAIAGMVQCVVRQGPFPNAMDLADRLLTLPTYCVAKDSVVNSVSQIIRNFQ